ncbi:DUF3795 domain-containing protein [bacterium]|nr:DUF3795 domain-containing protein [bacterium]
MHVIGSCADNCEYCPRYIATKTGRKDDFEKVKALWVRLGLRDRDCPVEDMACDGCLPEQKCAYTELRECVQSKAIGHCGWCDEYPCRLIEELFDKSEQLKQHAMQVCTKREMELLSKAFFSKRAYFEKMQPEI